METIASAINYDKNIFIFNKSKNNTQIQSNILRGNNPIIDGSRVLYSNLKGVLTKKVMKIHL